MTAGFCGPPPSIISLAPPARRPMAMTTPAMPATEGVCSKLLRSRRKQKNVSLTTVESKTLFETTAVLLFGTLDPIASRNKFYISHGFPNFLTLFTGKLIRQIWPRTIHSLLRITGIHFYLPQKLNYPRQ